MASVISKSKPTNKLLHHIVGGALDEYDFNTPQGRDLIRSLAHEIIQQRQVETVLLDLSDTFERTIQAGSCQP